MNFNNPFNTVVVNQEVREESMDYNTLANQPIDNTDLSRLRDRTANTYYRHTGKSTTTYKHGVIYFYDGTNLKEVTGGSNLIATTGDEMEALLTAENVGKTVTYIGESTSGEAVGTPFEVGDEVSTYYVNIDGLFDITKVDFSNAINDKVYLLSIADGYPILSADKIDFGNGTVYLLNLLSATLYYWSNDCTPQDIGLDNITEWGFEPSLLEQLSQMGWAIPYETYAVSYIEQQELWQSFMSKTPFTSGGSGYNKDTLYIITEDGSGNIVAKSTSGSGGLPKTSTVDAGKFLRVDSNGNWTAQSVPSAEGASV